MPPLTDAAILAQFQAVLANWTFTGGNNYNDKSGTAAIVINKANQTILVSAPSSKIFGDADFSVSATATSGFTVTFAGTTSSVCTLTSTGPGLVSVHIVAAGACSLTANQSGGGNFNPAPDVVVPITINPAKIKTILSITNGKYPNSAYLDTVVLSAKVTDMDHGNASLNSVGFIELKVFALESETSTVVFSATPTLLNGSMASNPSLNLDSNGVGTLSTTDLPVGGPRAIDGLATEGKSERSALTGCRLPKGYSARPSIAAPRARPQVARLRVA